MVDVFLYDLNYTEKAVITGACSLARNGLIYANVNHLDLQTSKKSLDTLQTIPCSFYYNDNIDWDYELTESQSNSYLLLPSAERAIVECIKHIDWIDEGLLIEALKDYLWRFWDERKDKLYAAANHFDVSKDIINYWLNEARNDHDD